MFPDISLSLSLTPSIFFCHKMTLRFIYPAIDTSGQCHHNSYFPPATPCCVCKCYAIISGHCARFWFWVGFCCDYGFRYRSRTRRPFQRLSSLSIVAHTFAQFESRLMFLASILDYNHLVITHNAHSHTLTHTLVCISHIVQMAMHCAQCGMSCPRNMQHAINRPQVARTMQPRSKWQVAERERERKVKHKSPQTTGKHFQRALLIIFATKIENAKSESKRNQIRFQN